MPSKGSRVEVVLAPHHPATVATEGNTVLRNGHLRSAFCGYCSKPFPGLLSKCDVAVLPPVPDDLSETEPDLAASSQADAPHVADGCAGTAASALAASAPAAG